jgi:YidC/Oxa1 family membrane protein insertase
MTSLAILAPVQFIIDVLKPVLVFIHDSLGVGWGLAIVLMTILVRAALAPLTVKQFKSMRAMAAVAPDLKKLQEKYKDDKQKQQQEVMKFYAENKINPFASCLPLVAQFPFFIGLYYLLRTDLRREICGHEAALEHAVAKAGQIPPPCGTLQHPTGAEHFLFIPDLTAGAHGWVLAVLMVLYVGSQLLSTILTPSSPDRNQQMLMYGLPLIFSIFILFYNFPAGLLVYWITTNLWTVTQGYVLRKRLGPIKPPAPSGGDGKPDGGGEGLLARLTGGALSPKQAAPARAAAKSAPSGPPPQSPRKKKKRSGRRR